MRSETQVLDCVSNVTVKGGEPQRTRLGSQGSARVTELRERVHLLLLIYSFHSVRTQPLAWTVFPHSTIWKPRATLALHQSLPDCHRTICGTSSAHCFLIKVQRMTSDSEGELKAKARDSRHRAHRPPRRQLGRLRRRASTYIINCRAVRHSSSCLPGNLSTDAMVLTRERMIMPWGFCFPVLFKEKQPKGRLL